MTAARTSAPGFDADVIALPGCGAERCGIDREVAALGVAAEQELPRKAQHGRGGITRREALGRNGAGEGHVEILLPADERAVRPAEGDKMPPVAEGDGDGRKLRLALEVDLVYIIHDPHLAEALTRRKGGDEPAVLRQEQRRLRGEELPHERADRRSLRRDEPVERQVGQAGQHERVYVAQRHEIERQIAAPVKIVKHIRHAEHLLHP